MAIRLTTSGSSRTEGGVSAGRSKPAWVSAVKYKSVQEVASAARTCNDGEAVGSWRIFARRLAAAWVCCAMNSSRVKGVAAAMMWNWNAVSEGGVSPAVGGRPSG